MVCLSSWKRITLNKTLNFVCTILKPPIFRNTFIFTTLVWNLIGFNCSFHFFEHTLGKNSSSLSALKTSPPQILEQQHIPPLPKKNYLILQQNKTKKKMLGEKQLLKYEFCGAEVGQMTLLTVTVVWLHAALRSRCVGGSTRGFLIITRGKTACIDDAHYSKYPRFSWVPGGWHTSAMAVNCQVANLALRPTSSQHCAHDISSVAPTWTAFFSPPVNDIHSQPPDSDASPFSDSENEQEWQRCLWLMRINH